MTLPPTPATPPVPTAPPRPVVPVPSGVSTFAARLEQAMDAPGASPQARASTTVDIVRARGASGVRPAQLPAVTLGAMIRSTTAVTSPPVAATAGAAPLVAASPAGAAAAPVAAGAAAVPGQGVLAGRLVTMPVEGRVSSTFGPRVHPITGEHKAHNGLDVAAPTGTDVRALSDGTVVATGERGGYGLTVEVDHGGGVTTRYAHLSAIDVAVGDRLAVGATLGAVGSTGFSTGPHLHLEVRRDGEPVDPETVLGDVH